MIGTVSVRSQTDQPPVSSLIQQRHLKLLGHIARAAASEEDHSRALRASTDRLPVDWCCPRCRPRQSWLQTIDSDLKPLNLGLHSALRRAPDRPSWRRNGNGYALRACHQMMVMTEVTLSPERCRGTLQSHNNLLFCKKKPLISHPKSRGLYKCQ